MNQDPEVLDAAVVAWLMINKPRYGLPSPVAPVPWAWAKEEAHMNLAMALNEHRDPNEWIFKLHPHSGGVIATHTPDPGWSLDLEPPNIILDKLVALDRLANDVWLDSPDRALSKMWVEDLFGMEPRIRYWGAFQIEVIFGPRSDSAVIAPSCTATKPFIAIGSELL